MALFVLLSGCIKKDNTYYFYYPSDDTVNDIDGNIYHLVHIKGQTWMSENLKTTRYRNGDTIAHVKDTGSWGKFKKGAWCNYGNDTVNVRVYGRLYNGYAAASGNLCPISWHVPYDYEWQALTDSLKGRSMAGGMLKETGTAHWQTNTGALNLYGFTARPGGNIDTTGMFSEVRQRGYWWSSTGYLVHNAWTWSMNGEDAGIYRTPRKMESGFSVRCIRDY